MSNSIFSTLEYTSKVIVSVTPFGAFAVIVAFPPFKANIFPSLSTLIILGLLDVNVILSLFASCGLISIFNFVVSFLFIVVFSVDKLILSTSTSGTSFK